MRLNFRQASPPYPGLNVPSTEVRLVPTLPSTAFAFVLSLAHLSEPHIRARNSDAQCDAIFDRWDDDGGGKLDLVELKVALKRAKHAAEEWNNRPDPRSMYTAKLEKQAQLCDEAAAATQEANDLETALDEAAARLLARADVRLGRLLQKRMMLPGQVVVQWASSSGKHVGELSKVNLCAPGYHWLTTPSRCSPSLSNEPLDLRRAYDELSDSLQSLIVPRSRLSRDRRHCLALACMRLARPPPHPRRISDMLWPPSLPVARLEAAHTQAPLRCSPPPRRLLPRSAQSQHRACAHRAKDARRLLLAGCPQICSACDPLPRCARPLPCCGRAPLPRHLCGARLPPLRMPSRHHHRPTPITHPRRTRPQQCPLRRRAPPDSPP